jgi:hypothetical protein
MTPAFAVKPLLKRGALVAAANWEAVVLQFVAEAAFKLLLVVPVVAAAFLVALIVGGSALDLAGADVRHLVGLVVTSLGRQPLALAAYLCGVTVIVFGGAMLTFLVKAGTVAVLVRADALAPPIEDPPLRLASLRRAAAFDLEWFVAGCRRFFRRYAALGLLQDNFSHRLGPMDHECHCRRGLLCRLFEDELRARDHRCCGLDGDAIDEARGL